jgi:hypothetical protein
MKYTKVILIVSLIFFYSGMNYAQYKNKLSLKQNSAFLNDSIKNANKLNEKSPLLAGSLSFFLPGLSLGQIYNEDYEKFGLHFGISAGVLLFAILASQNNLYELSTMNMAGGPGKEGKREWIFVLCVLTYAGNWLWSTIDAIHSATMYNRKIEQRKNKDKGLAPFKTGFAFDKNGKLKFLLRMDL